jgi:O-antigen/teichoic acid export membrane protein
LLLPLNFLVLDRWGRHAAVRASVPRGFPTGFWRYALPTMGAGLVGMLVFSRSEIVFLSWMGDAEAVGLFALAFGVAAQLTAPVDALLGPLLPAIAGIVNAHPSTVRAGRERSLRASSFLSGLILAGAVPSLTLCLPLIYGAAYEPAQYVFFVLALTATLRSVCNPLLAFFNARRQAGTLLWINGGALALNSILAVSLIPSLGIVGALVANSGAQLMVLALLVFLESRREDESALPLLASMRAWGIGLCSALLALWVGVELQPSPMVALFLAFFMGLFAFIAGIRVLSGGLLASDWEVLANALPPAVAPIARYGARLTGARLQS